MNDPTANPIFNVSASVEIVTGIVLIIAPEFTVNYLLGGSLSLVVVVAVTRVAGIALISMGVSAVDILNQPINIQQG